MYVLAICVSLDELSNFFAHFLIGLFYVLSCKSSISYCFINIFSILWVALSLLVVCFNGQNFVQVQFLYFFFCSLCFCCDSQEI